MEKKDSSDSYTFKYVHSVTKQSPVFILVLLSFEFFRAKINIYGFFWLSFSAILIINFLWKFIFPRPIRVIGLKVQIPGFWAYGSVNFNLSELERVGLMFTSYISYYWAGGIPVIFFKLYNGKRYYLSRDGIENIQEFERFFEPWSTIRRDTYAPFSLPLNYSIKVIFLGMLSVITALGINKYFSDDRKIIIFIISSIIFGIIGRWLYIKKRDKE